MSVCLLSSAPGPGADLDLAVADTLAGAVWRNLKFVFLSEGTRGPLM